MAATHPIISQTVGEGLFGDPQDVKRVTQLLALTGFLPAGKISTSWGKPDGPVAKAWTEFQKSRGWLPVPYVYPFDAEDRLGTLAALAGVLMRVPADLRGESAFRVFFETCKSEMIPYSWSTKYDSEGSRSIYGFQDRPRAVLFLEKGSFPVGDKSMRSFNCCSFVNLAISVWIQGNAHAKPYNPGQGVGGTGTQLGQRYSMPALKSANGDEVFTSLKDLQDKLKPNAIYHMALCDAALGTSTKHDVAIVNQTVYQSSPKLKERVYDKPLEEVWKAISIKRVRVFGPKW